MGWLTIASAGTIVAIVLGVYGAALSTINQVQRQRELKRRIRVTHEMGSLHPAPGQRPDVMLLEQDSPEHPANAVILIARNEGFRTVMLNRAGFLLPNGRIYPITTPTVVAGFPRDVVEGQVQSVPQDAQVLARDLRAAGFTGKVRLVGYFLDLLDNTYRSKPFDFDVDAWSALPAS